MMNDAANDTFRMKTAAHKLASDAAVRAGYEYITCHRGPFGLGTIDGSARECYLVRAWKGGKETRLSWSGSEVDACLDAVARLSGYQPTREFLPRF